jgi:CheY-like chemotaxis protein
MAAKRFTIVDDEVNSLYFLQRLAGKLYPGCSLATFTDPHEALQHINAMGTDLLITDHGMGEMSGTELILELRRNGFRGPIIMTSGNPEVLSEALEAGANAFIKKEGETEKMEQKILELMSVYADRVAS